MGAKRTEIPFLKEPLEVHMRNSKQQKHEQSPKGIYGSKADRNSFRGVGLWKCFCGTPNKKG